MFMAVSVCQCIALNLNCVCCFCLGKNMHYNFTRTVSLCFASLESWFVYLIPFSSQTQDQEKE